jgi:opacity protein-like surface antigen
MKAFIPLLFISCAFLFSSCKKNNAESDPVPATQPIDVSAQWYVDASGTPMVVLSDGQWQRKNFTTAEQNLFNSMDTATFAGTSKPDSVYESPSTYNCIYPNPFSVNNSFAMNLRFTPGYVGGYIMKIVITDNLMNPLFKKSVRFQAVASGSPAAPTHTSFMIMPGITATGKYRMYFTLSSQSNPHFYKCWGNVQVIN